MSRFFFKTILFLPFFWCLTIFGQNVSNLKASNNQLLWQITGKGLKKCRFRLELSVFLA